MKAIDRKLVKSKAPKRNNLVVLFSCLAFVAGMVGMSFAAVPLYSVFCKVTGFNGTTRQVDQVSNVILDQRIRVEFDTNTAGDLPWTFQAVSKPVEPRIGETATAIFRVTNRSEKEIDGQAVFNVTPMVAGAYFNKLECFCFSDTRLKPGETRDMPVVFYVDPDIVKAPETKDMKVLTLSYTFYRSDKVAPVSADTSRGVEETKKL